METTPKSRPWFVALPILVLLLMMLHPSIRTLMTSQFRLIFKPPMAYAWTLRQHGVRAEALPETDPGEEEKALSAVSSSHPQDYQIQLAYSLMSEWSHSDRAPDDRVKRLDALAGTFPARPTVYAHMLRYSTEREVKIRRESDYDLYNKQIPKELIKVDPDALRPLPDTLKRLNEFDRYAIAGEKLEPNNGYFSMMRAAGLFSAHDDETAIQCILSAAAKSDYNDHINDEMQADWKIASMAFDDQSAAIRDAIQGGISSPHLLQLDALGKAAAAVAIREELNGHDSTGANLRIAMAHCGALMRSKSQTMPGAITGAGIVIEQIIRPGGAPLIVEDVNFSNAEREEQRRSAYYKYVTKMGHPEEVSWMKSELAKDAEVKDIRKLIGHGSLSPYGRLGLRNTSWWLFDCAALTNVIYLLVPTIVILPFTLRKKMKPTSIIMILVVVEALAFAVAWVSQWSHAIMSLRGIFLGWIVSNSGSRGVSSLASVTDRVFDPGNAHLSVVGLALFSTIVTMTIIYRMSRKSNIIFVDNIKIDFVQVASVISTVLLLLYAGMVLRTASYEQELHRQLDAVMINEGKFLAPLIGREWPD